MPGGFLLALAGGVLLELPGPVVRVTQIEARRASARAHLKLLMIAGVDFSCYPEPVINRNPKDLNSLTPGATPEPTQQEYQSRPTVKG